MAIGYPIMSLSAHQNNATRGLPPPTLQQEADCKSAQIREHGKIAAAGAMTDMLLSNLSRGNHTENWRLVAIESEQSLKDFTAKLGLNAQVGIMQLFPKQSVNGNMGGHPIDGPESIKKFRPPVPQNIEGWPSPPAERDLL